MYNVFFIWFFCSVCAVCVCVVCVALKIRHVVSSEGRCCVLTCHVQPIITDNLAYHLSPYNGHNGNTNTINQTKQTASTLNYIQPDSSRVHALYSMYVSSWVGSFNFGPREHPLSHTLYFTTDLSCPTPLPASQYGGNCKTEYTPTKISASRASGRLRCWDLCGGVVVSCKWLCSVCGATIVGTVV